ncbi:MAG: transcriptional regulator [Candidatus Bathyarchaeota archaeon]|nr:MAG: transcriptional regulator [Candidatus Bathyarchaeota archaeon]
MEKKSDPENTFIEKFGLYFESYTLYPRIAGRIFGYLLICNPPHKSAKQIAVQLRIAKSSVSSMMRLLMQSRLVEQVSIPGERPRYYRIREGGWGEMFLRRLQGLSAVRELLSEGLELLKGKDPMLRERIEELDGLYEFFENEIPSISRRWEIRKKKVIE